jgi:hypothetical protein
MVNGAFAKWAAAYSGFVGGNPRGRTWLCGIEDTGSDTDETLVFGDASTPSSWTRGSVEFLKESPYHKSATKLLMSLKGRGEFESVLDFLNTERCFCKHSDYFKLNLYPIAFPNDSTKLWMPWLEERTGLPSKRLYWRWCAENRFPIFRKWVREFSPRIVVCTGVSYSEAFFSAFTNGEEQQSCTAGNRLIRYSITNKGKTLVAVIYFFSNARGLNSNTSIRETGARLAELVASLGK